MRTALVAVALGIVLLWIGAATGASSDGSPVSPVLPESGARDLVAVWSQVQDFSGAFNAYSSEHRTSDGFWCEGADDFLCSSNDTLTRVDWWGHERDLPAGEGVPEIPEFVIRFYADASTGRFHHPGDIVYEEHVFDFTAQYIAIIEKYHYSSPIPGGFAPTQGETYWLSIIAIHAFPLPNQQWSWYDCVSDDYWGAEGTMRSDFFGNPDWIPWSLRPGNYVEYSFVLYAGGDSPVERSSWSKVKALFR